MRICGFQKTTLLDYPEHVAATIFTGGCNFRCPFCHNRQLVIGDRTETERTGGDCRSRLLEKEIFEWLLKRRGILQGVCITGGEPTLWEELPEFMEKIKKLGFLVKLDTNGYRPKALREILDKGLADYVAMDVKASRENYANAAGVKKLDLSRIEESIDLLKGCTVPYEFRTTAVRGIHRPEEFEAIGKWLQGSRAYFLQAFRESENVLQEGFQAFSGAEMEEMVRKAAKYIDRADLRGVELGHSRKK